MNNQNMFYIDGSLDEVRAYQTGYLAGVHEGVLIGRDELVAEQLEAQRRFAATHQIGKFVDQALDGARARRARAEAA